MDLQHAEKLSEATRNVLLSPTPAYQQLVVAGSASGDAGARRRLEALAADRLLDGTVASRQHGDALLAGLWLWHDFLEESHAISQRLESATGSFWHAIMHRREGDFANAKYWYARCRNHPALAEIGTRVAQQTPDVRGRGNAGLEQLSRAGWDPDAFVDFVARVHRNEGDPDREAAVRLQRIEWAVLFDHCILVASGG